MSVHRACVHSGDSEFWGSICSLPFLAPRGFLPSLTPGSSLLPQSQDLQISSLSFSLSCPTPTSASIFKRPSSDYTGATQITRRILNLKILTLITSAKSLFPGKAIYWWLWRSRTQMSLWGTVFACDSSLWGLTSFLEIFLLSSMATVSQFIHLLSCKCAPDGSVALATVSSVPMNVLVHVTSCHWGNWNRISVPWICKYSNFRDAVNLFFSVRAPMCTEKSNVKELLWRANTWYCMPSKKCLPIQWI